jgi:hypothetical protein
VNSLVTIVVYHLEKIKTRGFTRLSFTKY